MTLETQTFENDKLSVEAHPSSGCKVKLDVLCRPSTVGKSYQEGIQRVKKEVSIPGFRKGKAPDSLILSHYKGAVEQEWKECLLNHAFQEALALVPFSPLKASAKEIKSSFKEVSNPQAEAKISYEFEHVPNAPAIDIASLKLEDVPAKEVSEEDVEDTIRQIRLSYATWTDINTGNAKKGDFVRLDIDAIKDGTAVPDFQNQRFEIQDKKMSPWLQNLVIGLEVGQSKEGLSTPEEALNTPPETASTFEPSLFKVTLKAIEEPTLPDLDEAFAQRLGVSTMEEVRANIKKRLQAQAQAEKKEEKRQKLEALLLEKYTFDLPQSLLNRAHDEKTKEREKKQYTLYYLMKKFNQENGVEITNSDLHQELSHLLSQFPQEMLPQTTKSLNEEIYTAILSEVVVRKGIEKLMEKMSHA